MLRQRVNGYDMAYIEVGSGQPLVCVHGSLGDFRGWSGVLGPLSRHHRVIAVSLRRFFPEHWDGVGDDFKIDQHVADMIAFIEALRVPKVHLLGHSRGGHIAFRVAQQRPELLDRLVLAEPGGDLDESLRPADSVVAPMRSWQAAAAAKVAAGDIEGAMILFFERLDGEGAWQRLPQGVQQELRDNAYTLLGQVNEQRRPYSRADAEGIRVKTLFVGGADTPGFLPVVLRALAAHVPGARVVMLPNAKHAMFEDNLVGFCAAVLEFLAAP